MSLEFIFKVLDRSLAAAIAVVLAFVAFKALREVYEQRIKDLATQALRDQEDRKRLEELFRELQTIQGRTLSVIEENTRAWVKFASRMERRHQPREDPG